MPRSRATTDSERARVVRAHTIEIDAENEPAVGATQNEAPTKPRAASMKPKSFGVAK